MQNNNINLNTPLYELGFHRDLFDYFKKKKIYYVADLLASDHYQVLLELKEISSYLCERFEKRIYELGLKFDTSLPSEQLNYRIMEQKKYKCDKEELYLYKMNNEPVVDIYTSLEDLKLPVSKSAINSLARIIKESNLDCLLTLDYWDMAKTLKKSSELLLVNTIHNLGFLFDFELTPEDLEKRNSERKEHYKNNVIYDIENTGIEILGFTNRTYGCLKRYGIDTIDELISLSKIDFEKIPGLGPRGLEEIRLRIIAHDFYYDNEEMVIKDDEYSEDAENDEEYNEDYTDEKKEEIDEISLLKQVSSLENIYQEIMQEMLILKTQIEQLKNQLKSSRHL